MALQGWEFPTTRTDLHTGFVLEAYLNTHRREGAEDVKIPQPWHHPAPQEAPVTPTELEALRAQLVARSAFRDR
ncbi:MAG TPA: hypothetical protein VIL55_08650 [Naasia sp.]|jgi:hypothetical protein